MKFKPMKNCARKVREQKYIWALLGAWDSLPLERRAELRLLMSEICRGAEEERALFDTAVRQKNPEAVSARTGVTARRIYCMRCRLYERVEIR